MRYAEAAERYRPLYREFSPWVGLPADPQPPLVGSVRADVVVIGGGYTGLSTALALREARVNVVVLERDFAGAGASGRNAGHLTPTIGKDIPTLLRVFGRERASRLVRFADAAVRHTEDLIRKHGIDCDYAPSGNVLAAVHPKHESRLRRAAETAHALGAEVRFLDAGAMRERGLPPGFPCGVLEERGGTLHPGRYVAGLRRAALAAGARLHEGTEVTSLEPGRRVVVRTREGEVVAEHAVIATNAYTAQLGFRHRLVAPLRVALFETAPLPEAARAALGWPGREGLYTSHEILESYRLTARGSIVGGSKLVRYRFGSGLAEGFDPEAFDVIIAAFRERFPSLQELPIAHVWGGWIGFTSDFLPVLGSESVRGSAGADLHYGLGFAGHGVAQATLMGSLLAARVQGGRHPLEEALARRVFAWPPEPLRWLAARLLNGVLEAVDRRTDRQARKRRRAVAP